MSATEPTAAVIEIEGDDATPPGHDRRRALVVAFAMCLAVGSAFLGQDGPTATAQSVEGPTLALQATAPADIVLFGFPDRLANEPPPPLAWVPVQVRKTEGLAVYDQHGISIVTWTELGTAYWLSSDRRHVDQLITIADSLPSGLHRR
ncbi:MAG: hypothetical protein E6H84_00450 [Chloroflexi bacterium]|nr:MAG: hypothetical protein E6H84_00450 [Chloroflexota bacterium]TMG70209.1 MAG: hypothetical protein E6H81_07865 [Chloroflexota bacterium]